MQIHSSEVNLNPTAQVSLITHDISEDDNSYPKVPQVEHKSTMY